MLRNIALRAISKLHRQHANSYSHNSRGLANSLLSPPVLPHHHHVHQRQFSSHREIEMSYSKLGGYVELKVPLPGLDEERMFYFNPHTTTVKSIIDDIQAEDPESITTVKLQGVENNGESKEYHAFEHDLPLKEILQNDFFLTINSNTFTIVPNVKLNKTLETAVASFDGLALSLPSVLLKASVLAIRDELQLENRMKPWSISVSDFQARCQAHGLSRMQAMDVAQWWHQTGECLLDQEKVKDRQMYLYPQSIIDTFFHKSLDLPSPTLDRVQASQTYLHEKSQALEPEYQRLTQLRKELDFRAERYSDSVCYLTSIGIISTFGLYWWLSFIHLSWDIMEPVTYFTGLGVSIGGYFWFNLTQREYEYQNVYDVIYQRRKTKLYRQRQLDPKVLENLENTRFSLHTQLQELEQMKQAPVLLQAVLYQDYLDKKDHDRRNV